MTRALPAVSTANMAEVLYLLDHGNRIIDMGLEPTLEGPSLFMVRLEGERAYDDHSEYLSHPTCSLSRLPFAFNEIMKAAGGEA